MFTKLNLVLLASGLAVGATALIAPLAMAEGEVTTGGGGVAGSAAFTINATGVVTNVATAAAVGQDVSTAWSFNDGTESTGGNSAGAMGASGLITVSGMKAHTLTSVTNSAPLETAGVLGFDMAIGSATTDFDLSSATGAGQGVAGSASFTIANEKPTGVATAAAVGEDVASAWSLSTGSANSAGSMGTAGTISVTGATATTINVANVASGSGGKLGFTLPLGGVIDSTGVGDGVAGSAAFTAGTDGKVTGVANAAAVGEDVAAAWSFNSGDTNSAGAMGSVGTITLTNMDSTTFGTIVNGSYATPTDASADRALGFGMNLGIKLADPDHAASPTTGDPLVNSTDTTPDP